MKTYNTDQIKNLTLLGNAGSGKTTLAECMLFEGKVIERRGNVEQKNTVSDYHDIEHENGNSIYSTVCYTEYNDKKINFIDNPGADDFSGGIFASLSVTDTALMVVNAQNGVEVGTDIQSRYVRSYEKPMIIAINQLDHDKANFDTTVESLKDTYGGKVTLLQYPVETGATFDSIVDLMKGKLLKYTGDTGKVEEQDIPDSEKDRFDEMYNELVEKAAENDEALMELFFEKESLTEEEINKGILTGLLSQGMYPVFCVSAQKNIGVGRLMEFITNVAPSPSDMPAPKTKDGKEVEPGADGKTAVFVFKTSIESHIGEVNFFKVMSGSVTENLDLINEATGNKERLSQIFAIAGKIRNKAGKMLAGDIGATVKLKATRTNHTLSAPGSNLEFEEIKFPEPKFRTAIRPASEGEEEKLGEALSKNHDEDPTIQVEYSKELKQIIVYGQGEHHLNIMKWHLENTHKVGAEFYPPKIPYRETITKASQSDYRHKKQSGGAGQFGEVHMIIEPYQEGTPDQNLFKLDGKEFKLSIRDREEHDLPWGGKLVFCNCIVGGSIDARFMPAILKGIMEKMEEGPLTGSYARDIRVYIYDGKMHPVDSNEISFKLAGRNAFREAFKKANPKILEPVYDVEVFVPSDRMGDVMSDLQGRRSIVQGMSSEGGFEKIKAKVPLAEMSKYATALSSLTGGRATYTMSFSEYSLVPGDIQEQLIKTYEEAEEEE